MHDYLTVYGLTNKPIIKDFVKIKDSRLADLSDSENLVPRFISNLVIVAAKFGFSGNIWQTYLVNEIINDENSYSLSCERKGEVDGTINDLALLDFNILREWFFFDFDEILDYFPGISLLMNYQGNKEEGKVYNRQMRDDIIKLTLDISKTNNASQMKSVVTQFYKTFGAGDLGLHKCFRIRETASGAELEPVVNISRVYFDDLIGLEIQKQKLRDNTDAFVEGRKANNCLLFGDSGTGKSTSIKALANEYFEKGLRIIEVYKHQFKYLNDIIAHVKKRNYNFVLYMDDLSFEDFEIEYKYLKALIEGGMEKRPDNVLIYATSNRRHLIKENYSDKQKESEDMHSSDTVQEKLSLSYRFGVTIYFGSPSKKEYVNIVKELAKKKEIVMDEDELMQKANAWELSHGGLSGRTAEQFTDYLKGVLK